MPDEMLTECGAVQKYRFLSFNSPPAVGLDANGPHERTAQRIPPEAAQS